MTAPTWRALQARVVEQLAAARVVTPGSEARWMLEHASGYSTAELLAAADEPATSRVVREIDEMVERRARGEPLQYVLGAWSFRELELFVDRRVIIPRPETELVAEVAIEELVRVGARRGRADPWGAGATTFAVADIGTGSGALALALATELPDAAVWATDVSLEALAVARANLAGAGLPATRVRLAAGSWFDALPNELRGKLRLVVSNPPYVTVEELAELPPEVADWEPVDALVSGPTGLEAIEAIVEGAAEWLEPAGVLVCELAPQRWRTVADRARAAGFAEVEVRCDLAGRERMIVARAPR